MQSGYTKVDFEEHRAVNLLIEKLESSCRFFCKINTMDKYPNIDGEFELLNQKLLPIKTFKTQIKKADTIHKLKNGQFSYELNTNILHYAKQEVTEDPIILFLIDINKTLNPNKQSIFWIHLSKEYVFKYRLQGENKNIKFSSENELLDIEDFYMKLLSLQNADFTKFEELLDCVSKSYDFWGSGVGFLRHETRLDEVDADLFPDFKIDDKNYLFPDVISFLSNNDIKKTCITGGGGAGKSVSFLYQCIASVKNLKSDTIYMYVKLSEIGESCTIIEYIYRKYLRLISKTEESFISFLKAQTKNKIMLMLDGINEAVCPSAVYQQIEEISEYEPIRVLISCRNDKNSNGLIIGSDYIKINALSFSDKKTKEICKKHKIDLPINKIIANPMMFMLYKNVSLFIKNKDNKAEKILNYCIKKKYLPLDYENIRLKEARHIIVLYLIINIIKRLKRIDLNIEEQFEHLYNLYFVIIAEKAFESHERNAMFFNCDDNVQQYDDNPILFNDHDTKFNFVHQIFRDFLASYYIFVGLKRKDIRVEKYLSEQILTPSLAITLTELLELENVKFEKNFKVKISAFNDIRAERYLFNQFMLLAFKSIIDTKTLVLPNKIYGIPISKFQVGVLLFTEELENVAFYNSEISDIGMICNNVRNIKFLEESSFYYYDECFLFNKNRETVIKFFNKNNLKKCDVPEGVKKIGESAFEFSFIEVINLPQSLTEIDSDAFFSCAKLKNISLPNGLLKIGDNAFSNCVSLKKIHIPRSVYEIGVGAFDNCDSLKQICVDKENMYFCCENGLLMNKDKTEIIEMLIESDKIFIPSTVKNISEKVFFYNDGSSLKTVEIDSKNTFLCFEDGFLMDAKKTTLKKYLSKEDIVVIPNGIIAIESNAFSYSKIRKITFSNDVKTIGKFALSDCYELREVSLNEGLIELEKECFCGCENLRTIRLPNSLKTIKKGAFSCCYALEEINLPSSLTKVDENIFFNCFALRKISTNLSDNMLIKIKDNILTSANVNVIICKEKS